MKRGYISYYTVQVQPVDKRQSPWNFIVYGDLTREQAMELVLEERVPQLAALQGSVETISIFAVMDGDVLEVH